MILTLLPDHTNNFSEITGCQTFLALKHLNNLNFKIILKINYLNTVKNNLNL